MIDLKELRRIAMDATPGPWTNLGDIYIYSKHFPVADVIERDGALSTVRGWGHLSTTVGAEEAERIQGANANHICAFSPDTALALIDELERCREEWATARTALQAALRALATRRATLELIANRGGALGDVQEIARNALGEK